MQNNFFSSFARIEDFEVMEPAELDGSESVSSGGSSAASLAFKIGKLIYRAHQYKSATLTINVVVTTYSFPAAKKLDKNKLLGFINDFNQYKPGLKAALVKMDGKGFAVNFSSEFIAPDGMINDELTHPLVKLLKSSGRMLLDSLKEGGFYEQLSQKK